MKVSIQPRSAYVEFSLAGSARGVGVSAALERIGGFLAEADPAASNYPFVLWDIIRIREPTEALLGAIVGVSTTMRLHGVRVLLVGRASGVAGSVARFGLGRVLEVMGSRAEALRLMLRCLGGPRTSEEFFQFLVQSGYVSAAQIDDRDGHRPRGTPSRAELLASGQLVGWEELLEAHVAFTHGRGPRASRMAASGDAGPPPAQDAEPPEALGQILLRRKIITADQLRAALDRQHREDPSPRLGALLTRMGLVSDDQVLELLEQQLSGRRRHPTGRDLWGKRSREARRFLLGTVLVQLGILSPDDLAAALAEQWRSPAPEALGSILLRRGMVTREQLLSAVEHQAVLKGEPAARGT